MYMSEIGDISLTKSVNGIDSWFVNDAGSRETIFKVFDIKLLFISVLWNCYFI